MKFNDSSTTGIVYLTRFYAKASSSDLTVQDIANLANIALDEVYPLASLPDRTLNVDDANYTDLSYGTFDIVSGTNKVDLSTDADAADIVGIRKVSLKDADGNWSELSPADLEDDELIDFVENPATTGTPSRYVPFGKNLVFDVTPDYSQTDGMRVFYRRAFKHFTASDTTMSPGFNANFHELVPLIAAHRWCVREGKTTTATELAGVITAKKADITEFYGVANEDNPSHISVSYESPA